MSHTRTIQLGIAIQGDAPPDAFRIFTAGKVVTSKGTFLFDDASASAVMADYAEHGNELMVDYDHASLSAMAVDPALASRAAGWFSIELRAGELWAVNVRWTEPAALALSRKEWRYMSPAFQTEGDRIVSLMNVALTNMPATRRLQPLMAANRKEHRMSLTIDELVTIRDALKMPTEATLDDLMAKLGVPAPVEEPVAEEPEDDAVAEASEPSGETPKDDEEKPEAAALVAAARDKQIETLTGETSKRKQLETFAVWKASHIELESVKQKMLAEQKLRDAAEYRRISVERVKAGVPPHEVWETSDKDSLPKSRWLRMSLPDYAEQLADDRKRIGKGPPRAPVTGTVGAEALTPRELAMCTQKKIDPVKYAAAKPQSRN